MGRIVFKPGQQARFLWSIKKSSSLNFKDIAIFCRKNIKTISTWYHEKYLMPFDIAKRLSRTFSVKLPFNSKIRPEFWNTKEAGRLGGIARYKRYGNPGTSDGRKLGGMRSVAGMGFDTKFKTRKRIKHVGECEGLAEFIGILLGDGNVTTYQVRITVNGETDSEYANWVSKLVFSLFGLDSIFRGYDQNSLDLIISSRNLVEYLFKIGLFVGSKIRNNVGIPLWIMQNENFLKACLRGLVDTDGCVYVDKHRNGNRVYQNICLDFSNHSNALLDNAFQSFRDLGFSPRKYGCSVKIRKERDVMRYFKLIGSHNNKHLYKIKKFQENGEVA